jgi:hypothetical protein
VLLEAIKSGRVNLQDMLAEPIDLSPDDPPEDLVEHDIGHVVVAPAAPVFRYSKGMLSAQFSDLLSRQEACAHWIRSSSGPWHRERPEVRDLQSLGNVDPSHGRWRFDEQLRALTGLP